MCVILVNEGKCKSAVVVMLVLFNGVVSSSVGRVVVYNPEGDWFDSLSQQATCFGVLGQDTKNPVLALMCTVRQLSNKNFPKWNIKVQF